MLNDLGFYLPSTKTESTVKTDLKWWFRTFFLKKMLSAFRNTDWSPMLLKKNTKVSYLWMMPERFHVWPHLQLCYFVSYRKDVNPSVVSRNSVFTFLISNPSANSTNSLQMALHTSVFQNWKTMTDFTNIIQVYF